MIDIERGSRGFASPSALGRPRRRVAERDAVWLVVALVAFFAVLTWLAPYSMYDETYDLAVYRTGALQVLHHHDPYAEPAGSFGPRFTYPPFAAVAFTPLALGTLDVDRVAATTISLACLLWLTLVAVRARCPLPTGDLRLWAAVFAVAALGLLFEPVRSTLAFGQVNLLLAALVAVDLLAPPRRLPQGVLVGLAAGLKLVPALFIVYLLVTGRRRSAAVALAVLAATVAVGLAAMPAAAWRFWSKLMLDTSRVGSLSYAGNQSLRGLLARLIGQARASALVWIVLAAAVLVVGLWVAVRLDRQGRELRAVCAVALAGLIVSPISWNHHWVWALPIALAALPDDLTAPIGTWTFVAAGWCLLFILGPIWWAGSVRVGAWPAWSLPFTNAYAIAGMAMLGFFALRTRGGGGLD